MRTDAVVLFAALTTFAGALVVAGLMTHNPIMAGAGGVGFWLFLTLTVSLSADDDGGFPSFATIQQAWDAYDRETVARPVLVDGELWEIVGRTRVGRLLDHHDRQTGRRCNECGLRRRGYIGIGVDNGRWVCSETCLGKFRDRYGYARGSHEEHA